MVIFGSKVCNHNNIEEYPTIYGWTVEYCNKCGAIRRNYGYKNKIAKWKIPTMYKRMVRLLGNFCDEETLY